MELQVVLNAFASDVFRKQADCDYIAGTLELPHALAAAVSCGQHTKPWKST